MMLERIRREHGYMVRLLAMLNKKLVKLRNEEAINYGVLKDIIDYLSEHSEKTHHPKEDLIYNYYLRVYGEQKEIDNLEKEHEELATTTHEFLDTVSMILQDAVVPLDLFANQLEEFIVAQKQHLNMEEQKILPLINETFTTKDWQVVEGEWGEQIDDPVFGDTIADQYKQLAERLKATEQECI